MTDTPSELKARITEEMKACMKAGDKARLGTIRLILAALKQKEVDERIVLSDADVLGVLDKLSKQRRESIEQYTQAGRSDLADQESFELGVIQSYLPEPLGEEELDTLIRQSIADTGACGVKDMGKVMSAVRAAAQGRADMTQVSARVKALLAG